MVDEQKPVQHVPVHQREDADVFDPRHPAASAFAPAQPGAGVVADDVEEKGQNLTGAPTASEASVTYADQKEVLAKQHQEKLQAAVPAPADGETVVDDRKGTGAAGNPKVVGGDAAKKVAEPKPVDKP